MVGTVKESGYVRIRNYNTNQETCERNEVNFTEIYYIFKIILCE